MVSVILVKEKLLKWIHGCVIHPPFVHQMFWSLWNNHLMNYPLYHKVTIIQWPPLVQQWSNHLTTCQTDNQKWPPNGGTATQAKKWPHSLPIQFLKHFAKKIGGHTVWPPFFVQTRWNVHWRIINYSPYVFVLKGNTKLAEEKLELVQYEPSPAGMVQSWIERYIGYLV